jgi:tetratricopeptide (TPR) repeat protein
MKAALNDPKTTSYFDRALAINEYSDEAFYGKGLYLQRKERYRDALSCYDRAATINKAHKLARYNSAVIYTLFEDWGNAEKWCNEVLELDDKYANAIALHGFINEKKGDKKAALADYKAALEIDPNNGPAKSGLKSLGGN